MNKKIAIFFVFSALVISLFIASKRQQAIKRFDEILPIPANQVIECLIKENELGYRDIKVTEPKMFAINFYNSVKDNTIKIRPNRNA